MTQLRWDERLKYKNCEWLEGCCERHLRTGSARKYEIRAVGFSKETYVCLSMLLPLDAKELVIAQRSKISNEDVSWDRVIILAWTEGLLFVILRLFCVAKNRITLTRLW